MDALTEKQQARDIYDLHLKSLIKNIEVNQKVNYKLLAKQQAVITVDLIIKQEEASGVSRSATIKPIEPMTPTNATITRYAFRSYWKEVLNEIELI